MENARALLTILDQHRIGRVRAAGEGQAAIAWSLYISNGPARDHTLKDHSADHIYGLVIGTSK